MEASPNSFVQTGHPPVLKPSYPALTGSKLAAGPTSHQGQARPGDLSKMTPRERPFFRSNETKKSTYDSIDTSLGLESAGPRALLLAMAALESLQRNTAKNQDHEVPQ
jgi:hypothetical protein